MRALRSDPQWPIRILILAALYYASARMGLLLAFGYRNVSPVWPTSGLALAGLTILGIRLWPAVLIGAFLANVSTGLPIVPAAFISAGNTLEAVLGALLLQQLDTARFPLGRIRDVTRFISIAIITAAVAATIGIATLGLSGFVSWGSFGPAWLTWWLGDAMGMVIATPLVLTWTARLRQYSGHSHAVVLRSLAEVLILSICLIGVTFLVFGSAFEIPYAIFPFLIWAAVRFGPSGSSLAVSVVSAISIVATLRGLGPFSKNLPEASLLHLQAWTATVSVTALVLAAATAERLRAEAEIANLNRQLNLAMEETHHRVKNNLQIVAAMVDFRLLQDKPIITPDDMRSLGSHVRALAVVHDILTREARESGEARTVSAKSVLDELIPLIQASADGKDIAFKIDDARLSTRQGTSLALVANELINNAFKHGRGTVEVSFAVNNGTGRLDVRDHGAGFPTGFQVDSAETSGLSMVTNLVRVDLSGSVSFNGVQDRGDQNRGAQVSVQIPLDYRSPVP